jgi:HipA-like protein
VADRLVAWLYDTPVAALIRGPEFRIRLEWRPEGIERWGLGSPALSVGLPIGAPIGPRDLRSLDFFENMLPEGAALERLAALAGVRPVDTYGILAAFGRDCAGAIMVLPDEDRRRVATPVRGRPLDLDPQARWPARDGRQRGHLFAPRRRLWSDGARGGAARRRRPARPGGQALRPAGRSGRGHPGPGASGRRLPGHRHASRAEVRGTRRPCPARPGRGHQELRRSPRGNRGSRSGRTHTWASASVVRPTFGR